MGISYDKCNMLIPFVSRYQGIVVFRELIHPVGTAGQSQGCSKFTPENLWLEDTRDPETNTPLKFNMEPENKSLEKEIPFGNHHSQVPC